MSNPEGSSDLASLSTLDEAVERAVERIRALETGLEEARERTRELEAMLQRFTGDETAPARMLERLQRLEEENGDMKRRLEAGRASVERLLARIRFLEEKR